MGSFEAHFLASLDQTILEVQDALTSSQARLKLISVEGLDQVIVGAGFQPCNNIFFGFARGEQNHVDVVLVATFSDATANTKTVELGHHPIEQCETWSVRFAQPLDCFPPVGNGGDFIPGALKSFLQETAGQGVVIGDQYLHGRASCM